MAEPARTADGRIIVWQPQPGPQTALLTCPVYEVFFGGARGGGKTDGILGEWAAHAAKYGADAIGLMVRRTRLQLTETFERAKALYRPLGATFTEQPMRCMMPGGARLNFQYLERDADAENYQGHSYTRVYIEEAGNFPSPTPILKLMATLRSGAGVPCRIRLTGNPGGPGQHWIKARYIDPAPRGMKVLRAPETGLDRVYIPSRVTDNRYLDQQYVSQLRQLGSPELVKAWLDGDWSVIAGAFFPEFSMARHVIPTRGLPEHWARFAAADWGSAKPFAVVWLAVSDGALSTIPRGALVAYREWYGMKDGEPNVGLRLPAEEVARGAVRRETGEKLAYRVLDPAAFAEDGGPSLAERMARAGWMTRRADNARVARNGAMGGWDQVRSRLVGTCLRDEKTHEVMWDTGQPMLFSMACCTHLIRTLPGLQHDAARPEDVDTEGEDHMPDALRYGCMSRPYVREAPKVITALPPGTFRISDLRPERRASGGRI